MLFVGLSLRTRTIKRLLFPDCLLPSFGIPHSGIQQSGSKIHFIALDPPSPPKGGMCVRASVEKEIESTASFHPVWKTDFLSVTRFPRPPSFNGRLKFFFLARSGWRGKRHMRPSTSFLPRPTVTPSGGRCFPRFPRQTPSAFLRADRLPDRHSVHGLLTSEPANPEPSS